MVKLETQGEGVGGVLWTYEDKVDLGECFMMKDRTQAGAVGQSHDKVIVTETHGGGVEVLYLNKYF